MVFWKTQKKVDDLHAQVKSSFAKVRTDMDGVQKELAQAKKDNQNLFRWVQYLREQNNAHRSTINRVVKAQRDSLGRAEVIHILRSEYPVDRQLERIEAFERRMARMETLLEEARRPKIVPVEVPKVSERPRTSNLQQKIVQNVSRKSKEYIKKTLLSLLAKYERISGTSLREIVVDEQKLCSRSSFYRLLEELVKEGLIDVVSSGRERVFSSNRKVFKGRRLTED
ncbi:hypothetical protein GF342_02640 [Candidatus Woesearchaeota archaeon]|nr:hypothetical protein [Candidatus Woesearchaeota archaeon]